MGIDIYARWDNQSADEMAEQGREWLCATAGGKGYLREAYHGIPYATKHLCPEAFLGDGEAPISAALLRKRLPRTLELVEERERTLYESDAKAIEEVKQSFKDFVALCERKEAKTGKPVLIIASY